MNMAQNNIMSYTELVYTPIWNDPTQAFYDIEMSDCFAEVKSSINRNQKVVAINSIPIFAI